MSLCELGMCTSTRPLVCLGLWTVCSWLCLTCRCTAFLGTTGRATQDTRARTRYFGSFHPAPAVNNLPIELASDITPHRKEHSVSATARSSLGEAIRQWITQIWHSPFVMLFLQMALVSLVIYLFVMNCGARRSSLRVVERPPLTRHAS